MAGTSGAARRMTGASRYANASSPTIAATSLATEQRSFASVTTSTLPVFFADCDQAVLVEWFQRTKIDQLDARPGLLATTDTAASALREPSSRR